MRVLLALALTGCVSSETTAGGDCGDAGLGEACRTGAGAAHFCALDSDEERVCVSVCANAKNLGEATGEVGAVCEVTADCSGFDVRCDNQRLGGDSTCRCVSDAPEACAVAAGRWLVETTCRSPQDGPDGMCVYDRIPEEVSVTLVATMSVLASDDAARVGLEYARTVCTDSRAVFSRESGELREESTWSMLSDTRFTIQSESVYMGQVVQRCTGTAVLHIRGGSGPVVEAERQPAQSCDAFHPEFPAGLDVSGEWQVRRSCVVDGACTRDDEAWALTFAAGAAPSEVMLTAADGWTATGLLDGPTLRWMGGVDGMEFGAFGFQGEAAFVGTSEVLPPGATTFCTYAGSKGQPPAAPGPNPPCPEP